MIDGEKVDRETFFDTLNEWGRTDKKFVVLHHSILSEGINVNGLEAVLFMSSMDYIGISHRQSVELFVRAMQTKYSDLYVFQFTLTLVSQLQERSKQLLILYSTKEKQQHLL